MSGGIGPKEWLEDKHVLVTASRLDGTISLEEQALWLARHIDEVESPATSLVSSEELRGMILVRAITLGAAEHGDSVFHKTADELRIDQAEEYADAEFYRLVETYGSELASGE